MDKVKNWISGKRLLIILMFCFGVVCLQPVSAAQQTIDFSSRNFTKIEQYIKGQMKKARIPGLGVVVVRNDKIAFMKGYGYADVESKKPLTPDTLMETASCSKGYTAVAVYKLIHEGKISPDDYVSKYFPGFFVTYKGQKYDITIGQLLHHSSCIPETSIVKIPASTSENALYQVVQNVAGIKLSYKPGERFLYATVNYDILGAIIQKVSGKLFEDYMQDNVFIPLGLKNTTLDNQDANPKMATGYKMRFLKPVSYQPPIYRGNRPAGYVITDLEDTARWLMFQLGTLKTDLEPIIQETHMPDRTVEPSHYDYGTYASGWAFYQYGSGELAKSGMNPTFSAYMAFRPNDQIGVAVFSNLGTEYTFVTGHGILNMLRDEKPKSYYRPEEGLVSWDNPSFIITLFCGALGLALLAYLGFTIYQLLIGKRRFVGVKFRHFGILILVSPLLLGLYLFPNSLGFSWETALAWLPSSFGIAVVAILATAVLGYLVYLGQELFPSGDSKLNLIPGMTMLSLVSGIGNYFVIAMINSYIYSHDFMEYKIYYFVLAMLTYLAGRKIVETQLIKVTNSIIYEKRVYLLSRIFATPYQEYEKLDNGRILSTLNNDSEIVSNSVSTIVAFITYFVTIICCFIYLGTISFLGMLLSVLVIIVISVIYGITTNKANIFWEQARDTQNLFMGYLDSLTKGFKELSLHRSNKKEFQGDVADSCREYRDKRNSARIKFLNSYLVGESMLILVLGVVVFSFPSIFENIQDYTLAKFTITFLYLIGPINGLLSAMPQIAQMIVSWKRIEAFVAEIPEQASPGAFEVKPELGADIESIRLLDVFFQYSKPKDSPERSFSVGPVNLEVKKGEILFITGGNGSGKSTLAKILTGLYSSYQGNILINNKPVEPEKMGELFTAVFSDCYLFDKLYGINVDAKREVIDKHLKMLKLDSKVDIIDGRFSTLKLSTGQKKRLALLVSMLDDRPICLFDEWAADQDPQFRGYFYRKILLEMKAQGKIIFVISHDEFYFDIADKIIRLKEEGQVEIGDPR